MLERIKKLDQEDKDALGRMLLELLYCAFSDQDPNDAKEIVKTIQEILSDEPVHAKLFKCK